MTFLTPWVRNHQQLIRSGHQKLAASTLRQLSVGRYDQRSLSLLHQAQPAIDIVIC
jgi:hypothetical protein